MKDLIMLVTGLIELAILLFVPIFAYAFDIHVTNPMILAYIQNGIFFIITNDYFNKKQ